MPVPAPEGPRPYPYAVLGVQPGGLPEEARAALEAELGAPIQLEPTEIILQLPAPDGRVLEFTFAQHLASPRPLHAGFGGDDDTYDRFGLVLATPALEGRVLGLYRSMRAPTGALPQYPALRAQLVALHGEPSDEQVAGDQRIMTWAWAEDGLVADLADQPERRMEFEAAAGEVVPVDYRPCAQLHHTALEYGFTHPRRGPAFPGCVATYSVSHATEMGFVRLGFTVADYALGRLHREAADAQLVEWLRGGAHPRRPRPALGHEALSERAGEPGAPAGPRAAPRGTAAPSPSARASGAPGPEGRARRRTLTGPLAGPSAEPSPGPLEGDRPCR